MHDISTNITAAPRTKGEFVSNRRARKKEAKRVISLLAERLPAAFVADKRAPHRLLKVGVHTDLVATGLLAPREVKNALVVYTGRPMYQAALAGGGARVCLDGNPAGEVTQDQIGHAVDAVASIEAKAEAVRKQKAARKAARERVPQQPAPRTPPPPPPDSAPRRFSLTDLKAAAAARRKGGAP
jgi:sRNA-binding protein